MDRALVLGLRVRMCTLRAPHGTGWSWGWGVPVERTGVPEEKMILALHLRSSLITFVLNTTGVLLYCQCSCRTPVLTLPG